MTAQAIGMKEQEEKTLLKVNFANPGSLEYLTFDDVLIKPCFSSIRSRKDVDPTLFIGAGDYLSVPIVLSNMASVCNGEMAGKVASQGGMAVFPRFGYTTEQFEQDYEDYYLKSWNYGISVGGENDDWIDICKEYSPPFINLDFARGDSTLAVERTQQLRRRFEGCWIVSGNVVTGQGAVALANAGADLIKVGVGAGAACTTRIVSGVGVPQVTCLQEVHEALVEAGLRDRVKLLSDGGVRYPGDIPKAIVAGADAVISGFLFAHCEEAPGESYRGNSTYTEERTHEGVEFQVSKNTRVHKIMSDIEGGLRSAMSYCNSSTLVQLRERAELVRITSASQILSRPVKWE